MTYFLKSGITFRVSSKEAMDLHEKLPAGNYTIKKDPFDNLYLESIDSFEIKGKRYGDLDKNTDRILNTFMDRTASTGVMLTGEKGSGKSLLAKALSIQAAKDGIPTIVINQPWTGDKFNALIQSIEQPCVVLFDEFEKVYDSQEQEAMLTLLDGVFPSKKLFVITCNDKWRVDSHMRNRPGRIYYMLDYKGLTHDFIIEYCEDNLKNQTYIERICSIASLFSQFNFDMLKALIEEMNRYDESPEEALKMLNAKPEFDDGNKYITNLNFKGIPVDQKHLEQREWKGNPLQSKIHLSFKVSDAGIPWTDKDENDEDADWNWEETQFNPGEIQKIDPATGTFIFMNKDGVALTLTKVKEKTFQYYDAF
jgi:hypothetical protein